MKLWKKIALLAWLGLGIFSAIGSSLQINNQNVQDVMGSVYRLNPFTKKLDKVNTSTDFVNDFLYKPGLAGGQIAYGGTGAGEGLNLFSNPIGGGYINLDQNFNINPVGVSVTGSLYVNGVNDMPQFMVSPVNFMAGGQYSPTAMFMGYYGQPFVTLLSQPELLLIGDAPAITGLNSPLLLVAKSADNPVNVGLANESTGTKANVNLGFTNNLSTASMVDPTAPPTHSTIIGRTGGNFADPNFDVLDADSGYAVSTGGNMYLGSFGTTATDGNTYFVAGGRNDKSYIGGVFTWDNKFGVGQDVAQFDLDVKGHFQFQIVNRPVNASTAILNATAGVVTNGTHRIKYTYLTPTGETDLSTGYTEIVVTGNKKIDITDLPIAPDKSVSSRRVYMTKAGSLVSYYFIGTISNNTASTYQINTADTSFSTLDYRGRDNTTAGKVYKAGVQYGLIAQNNLAWGYLALSNSQLVGYYNFGMGNSAGRRLSGGSQNTFIANFSGENATTATGLTATGYNTFNAVLTDNYANAYGSEACTMATAVQFSTVDGYQGLKDATDITGMTVVGARSGYYPNGLVANKSTTSTYSTWVGGQTGLASATQRTKTITIGWNSVVDADNTAVIGGTGADAVDTVFGGTTARGKVDVLGTVYMGGLTDYSNFEADGTYHMSGGATVFKDMWTGIDFARTTGATNATMIGHIKELYFTNGDNADLPFIEIKHDYKEGTDLALHLHIATRGTNASAYNVKYEYEYIWADENQVFTGPTTGSIEFTIPGGTTALTHKMIPVAILSGTGKHIGSQLKFYFKKVAASVNDAPVANDPFVLQFGLHYEADTLGSRTTSSK